MLELKLKGVPWKVKFRDKLRCYGEASEGMCDYDHQTIWLRRNIPRERKGLTLTHECLHVALESLNLPAEMEDSIIAHIEDTVYELINKFPEQYKWKKSSSD